MSRHGTRPGEWRLHPQLAEDTVPLAHWPLSELRLMDDANHPWLVLVPRVAGAVELIDLADADLARLTGEIARASHALRAAFAPDKLNVAALGNLVPQLHVHVIARFRDDIAWPRPVWGNADARRYPPDALARQVERLRAALAA
ncbi:MAG: HIT family protein [Gammaproteobacteria bacterium]